MAVNIRRRDWFESGVSEQNRIGNHLLLMKKDDYWTAGPEPFLADATTAIFLTRGTAEVSINMTDYHVTAPSMIIYMEGMIVSQHSVSEDARMDVIIISRDLTDDILSESNVYGQLRGRIMSNPVFPLSGQEKVTVAFNYLLMSMVRMKDSPYRLEAARHMSLTLFYGFALSGPSAQVQQAASRSDSITGSFFQLVKEHYRTQRAVSFYASELCITSKYLSQSVREATGRPALEWIDEYVCSEAKALLRSTGMTMEQISDQLGFANQSLFGKYFKRITGMSPRSYRNLTR